MAHQNLNERIKWSDNRFMAWMTFFRPINGCCAAFGTLAVALLAAHTLNRTPELINILIGTLITLVFTCAIIGHHDFYDKADQKTHPWRALHRNIINRNYARAIVITQFVLCGVLAYLFLSDIAYCILVTIMVIGIVYNRWSKYRPEGVFVVSICTAMVVPFGCALVVKPTESAFLALWPFFIGLTLSEICRECGNYCQDYKGDLAGGSITLPVVIGRKRTMIVGLIFLILSIPFFMAPCFSVGVAGPFVIGCVGYIAVIGTAWINTYSHISSQHDDEIHLSNVFELNWRYCARFYLLMVLQPLMIVECYFGG